MKTQLKDFNTGWYGITFGVKERDIDDLIEALKWLKTNTDQHFHLSSDYEGEQGVGEIEIYVQNESAKDNMHLQLGEIS